ncbi:hypothetical protein ACYOEI_06385 [Singulisphaera rosea]
MGTLLRSVALMMIALTISAIGVARLHPKGAAWRMLQASTWVNLDSQYMAEKAGESIWLDIENGRVSRLKLPEGESVEMASCSPFRDDNGRAQAVGRWATRTKVGADSVVGAYGLARFTYPDGEIIDRVTTDIIPKGPPCWYPGTKARILFSAIDGKLYHHNFEPSSRASSLTDPELSINPGPRPLKWLCPHPGDGHETVSDPFWSSSPTLAARLIVSIRPLNETNGTVYSFSRLWWLELDEAGTSIVAAGRLIPRPDSEPEHDMDERFPAVWTNADGRMTLAYQTRLPHQPHGQIRVVPLELDASRKIPVARTEETRILVDRCAVNPPSFSKDGKSLFVVHLADGYRGEVLRVPLSDERSFAASSQTFTPSSGELPD